MKRLPKPKVQIIKNAAHWKRLRKSSRWVGFPEILPNEAYPFFCVVIKGKVMSGLLTGQAIILLYIAAMNAHVIW